ncbi:hypothetical protein [Nocardia sp. NPDC059239]|uniref:hypothetical protein n=1 Tax=unclassified Nocardia TaxID=2637762 RepID=UPI0036B6CBE7
MSLLRLTDGRSRLVNLELERRLLAVDPRRPVHPLPPSRTTVDEDVLTRILAGSSFAIVAKDKPVYARVLHREHGWAKGRIGKELGMSGTKVNKH